MTSTQGHIYQLPGSGPRHGESVFRAGLRALEEETGLQVNQAKTILSVRSNEHEHTVIHAHAKGKAKPRKGIKTIKYYNDGDELSMSPVTHQIIRLYREYIKEDNPSL